LEKLIKPTIQHWKQASECPMAQSVMPLLIYIYECLASSKDLHMQGKDGYYYYFGRELPEKPGIASSLTAC